MQSVILKWGHEMVSYKNAREEAFLNIGYYSRKPHEALFMWFGIQ